MPILRASATLNRERIFSFECTVVVVVAHAASATRTRYGGKSPRRLRLRVYTGLCIIIIIIGASHVQCVLGAVLCCAVSAHNSHKTQEYGVREIWRYTPACVIIMRHDEWTQHLTILIFNSCECVLCTYRTQGGGYTLHALASRFIFIIYILHLSISLYDDANVYSTGDSGIYLLTTIPFTIPFQSHI